MGDCKTSKSRRAQAQGPGTGSVPLGTNAHGEEGGANKVGTALDDGAEPTYEDGSPIDPPPNPNPAKPDPA